jgi:hypothetical protein
MYSYDHAGRKISNTMSTKIYTVIYSCKTTTSIWSLLVVIQQAKSLRYKLLNWVSE